MPPGEERRPPLFRLAEDLLVVYQEAINISAEDKLLNSIIVFLYNGHLKYPFDPLRYLSPIDDIHHRRNVLISYLYAHNTGGSQIKIRKHLGIFDSGEVFQEIEGMYLVYPIHGYT